MSMEAPRLGIQAPLVMLQMEKELRLDLICHRVRRLFDGPETASGWSPRLPTTRERASEETPFCTPRLSLLGSALTPLFSKQRPKWLPSPGIPPSHITVQLPVEPYHLQLASRMLSARGKSTMR
ncbi:hypothetical protein N7470_009942 [Penicillium chermesinum]|nr:hypothetical protein N7470_009942 [Penicillium chermesinum]